MLAGPCRLRPDACVLVRQDLEPRAERGVCGATSQVPTRRPLVRHSELPPKLQRELELAVEVQRSMLPERLPTARGYSFWVSWQPASSVSGDLYDFQILKNGEILFLAADVAGKGFPAAIGMASVAGMVPLVVDQAGADLPAFVSVLNTMVYRWASRANRFVTLIAVALDCVAHRMRVVNAGHRAGVIRHHDGVLENLCPDRHTGLALGVTGKSRYSELEFRLGLGDAVVIVSDGITNSTNANGEVYGTSRLFEAVPRTEPEAAKLGEALLANVRAFMGTGELQDDIVVICIARA
jgi:phosphoserine phosphatase RsbU/P